MYKWCFVFWSLTLFSCGLGEYLSRQKLEPTATGHDEATGWDIRLAVPGEPGRDYPTLATIPKTGFTCSGKKAGYYADMETNCQVFRVCTIGATYGFQSFLCPNGTLFNQQVFVCDWWMNVNCQGSQRYYNSNNNDKFGNLRLGPSMMTDIKKMLIYPMNNPYRNNELNNNQFVMQIYNPPSGQPFSNSVTSSDNNIFSLAQQLQLPVLQQNNGNINENQFAGSTPSPQYVPTNQATNEQLSHFQNGQLISTQSGQCPNCQRNGAEVFSNVNAKEFGLLKNKEIASSFSKFINGQNYDIQNGAYTNGHILNNKLSHNQANLQNQNSVQGSQKYQFSNTLSTANQIQNNQQSGKVYEFTEDVNNQYNDQQKIQNNGGGQNELEITFTKQQYTYPSQYDKQYTYKIPTNQVINGQQIGHLQEVKQNLVSKPHFNQHPNFSSDSNKLYIPPTISAAALSINKDAKSGNLKSNNPRSQITIKSWVVQPSKSAQSNSKQSPYKYENPKSSRQYLVPQSPRRTISSRLYSTPSTVSPPTSRLYLTHSSTRPTPKARLNLTPSMPRPTISAKLYLTPSNLKTPPLSPIVSKPTQSSRFYSYPKSPISARLTASSSTQEPIYNRNVQLVASASTVTPIYLAPLRKDPKNNSFTITKQSYINTNHNNLTFTDILTKEKLDITVNNIVKDTSNILESGKDVNTFQQLRLEHKSSNDDNIHPSPVYVPSHLTNNQNSNKTNNNELISIKSSRQKKEPSTSLEIPVESVPLGHKNQISTLPYFKPRDEQTMKTVSLKISVPEKIAQYIVRSNNESDFDRLEILTTGSSNYLVLTNGRHSQKNHPNFIPLGKLVSHKNYNVSNSQAFVYDFLSNSINAAKTYENSLNDNVKNFKIASTQTFGQQFENIDAEALNDITTKISQLTSAQYNNNININNLHNTNLVSSAQTTTDTGDNYRGTAKFTNSITQNDYQQDKPSNGQIRQNNEVNGNFYSSNFYSGNNDASAKLQLNPNEVTQNYYTYHGNNGIENSNNNQQTISYSDFTTNGKSQGTDEFQKNHRIPNDPINVTTSKKSSEVEFIQTGLPQSSSQSAKLQVDPTTVSSEISVEEDNLNNENGVGAQFHKKKFGTINHPITDRNLVAYKADRSFYFYTNYLGSRNNGVNQNIANSHFDELQQNQQNNAKRDQTQKNKSNQVTTVQFIPSLGFQLDDNYNRQDLLKVLQNQRGPSAAYTSGIENESQDTNGPTSSADYSVYHTVPTKQTPEQQYRDSNANLYTGPSSYSAPQSSVGKLELPPGQHLNVGPSLPSNSFVPARLEDFGDVEDTAGYPRVTPDIPFPF